MPKQPLPLTASTVFPTSDGKDPRQTLNELMQLARIIRAQANAPQPAPKNDAERAANVARCLNLVTAFERVSGAVRRTIMDARRESLPPELQGLTDVPDVPDVPDISEHVLGQLGSSSSGYRRKMPCSLNAIRRSLPK